VVRLKLAGQPGAAQIGRGSLREALRLTGVRLRAQRRRVIHSNKPSEQQSVVYS
jgi:hypothetical protein